MQKGLLSHSPVIEMDSQSWFPTTALKKLLGRPTSSDVHLYADIMTLDTDRPILWVDCEGLNGGETDPITAGFKGTGRRLK